MKAQTIEFLNELPVSESITDYLPEDFNYISFDQIIETLEESGYFDQEIIYYHRAMAYLLENDPSLVESLELAGELGFTPENLNSETLATLHYQDRLRAEIFELEDEINDHFENLHQ